MALPVQISLNKKRLTQLEQIRTSRDEFKNLMLDDVAKALLFEKIDGECAAAEARIGGDHPMRACAEKNNCKIEYLLAPRIQGD